MAEKLTEIELESVQLHMTQPRTLSKDDSPSAANIHEDDIETALGLLHVCIQGDRSKPAIITYHDIGLNSNTCFQGFFSYPDMHPILKHFCAYHINAPGQQEGSMPLPHGLYVDDGRNMKTQEAQKLLDGMCQDMGAVSVNASRRASMAHSGDPSAISGYSYPSMDQLAEMILPVLQFYSLRSFIGFGVGAGSNILCRFALAHPEKVDALVLVNCTASKAGWTEWGYQKLNAWYLRSGQLTQSVEDYLLWHWFGDKTMQRNHDLVTVYRQYIKAINPHNLSYFIESYSKRNDLGIVRDLDPTKKRHGKNLKCPVMLIAGVNSPHLDDVVVMNGRLDPGNSTWMKFEDCGGMVLEEHPEKLCEAFRLFLQGMGYVPSLSQTKLVESRTALSRASFGSANSPAAPTNLPAPVAL